MRSSDLSMSDRWLISSTRMKLGCGAALSCLVLAGCGQQGQPVATVNGEKITAAQLQGEMMQVEVDKDEAGRERALDKIIDRHLLQSEALRNKLDRDPTVKAAIDNAKAEILAQAYLHSRLAYVDKPTKSEVENYFHQHPLQFARRRIFDLNEIVIPSAQVSEELKTVLESAKSLDDVAAWLDGQRILYTQARIKRNTAEMPAAMANKLRDLEGGQMALIRDGAGTSLVSIVGIQDSPVTLEAAAPQIERLLMEKRSREMGLAELTRLRSTAKVEYLEGAVSRTAAAQPDLIGAKQVTYAGKTGINTEPSQLK